ncbi:MAG: BolA family transcriptional regulator [Proteobacteria bacterium]|nr:BolA family transcriptional regulator [Pseudomonadota bacterium]
MALKILSAADDVLEKIEAAIRAALPESQVQVKAGGAGHFEVSVVAEAFRGKSMVQQHQLVYGAIAPLMAGDAPPVHAIDRLQTKAP